MQCIPVCRPPTHPSDFVPSPRWFAKDVDQWKVWWQSYEVISK